MSTEPIKPAGPVLITIRKSAFDGRDQHLLARLEAAAHFQVGRDDVVCLQVGEIETTPASLILDTDGNPITPVVYKFVSTWDLKPQAEASQRQRRPRTPWPSLTLSRGARWQGMVPDDDGNPVEAMLISTGDKLVHLDSPEGVAILLDLNPAAPEPEGPTP